MSALHADVVRLLTCGDVTRLLTCTPLAVRVFLHLFWGDDSERAGFARCRPGGIADDLTSSRRAVVAALDELQAAGLMQWSAAESLAVRAGYADRFWPLDRNNSVNWQRAIAACRPGPLGDSLREVASKRIDIVSERKSIAFDDAQNRSVKSNRHRFDGAQGVESVASDSEATSQATCQATSQGSPLVRESLLPATQVSPAAADDAPRADKQAGEQLSLTMPPQSKPRKPPSPKVQDALALQRIWNTACETVEGWAHASRLDGACVKHLPVAMSILRQRLTPNPDDPEAPIWALLEFANTDPWWNGTKHGVWGILQFFAAGNLDRLITEYNRKRNTNAA